MRLESALAGVSPRLRGVLPRAPKGMDMRSQRSGEMKKRPKALRQLKSRFLAGSIQVSFQPLTSRLCRLWKASFASIAAYNLYTFVNIGS